MKNTVTRTCAWVSLALLTYAPLATAQTLEIYAGGGHFVDIPGNTIGLQPGGMAAGADGFIYVNDINGRLMRLNTATGLVSALPATPGGLAYNIGYGYTVATDFAGRVHVKDNSRLKRIEANGTLTDVGEFYYNGNSAFGPDGSLYVAGGYQQVYVRRPSGEVQVFAGLEDSGFSGDGGPAASAALNGAEGVAVAQNGDVYIADTQNHRIRRVSAVDGIITTFAGTGTGGFVDGAYRTSANISSPTGLTFDAGGNLFVTTNYGGLILRIDAVSGLVTKIGGGGSGVDGSPATSAYLRPRLIALDAAGNVYFSDWRESYQKIRKITKATGIVSLAIGYDSFYFCGENVPARQVCLAQPLGIDVTPNGDLLFADPVYRSIRKIAPGTGILSTWKTTTESAIGIEHDAAGNIYVASFGGYQINRYDAVTGAKTVVAGNGSYGSSGDGGPATRASLMSPTDVAIDASGNLYIADDSGRIRKVTAATGLMSSLANIHTHTLELAPDGMLISTGSGCSLYRVDPQTGASSRIAGTGTCGYLDPPGGTPANATQLPDYLTFAVAPNGNVYLGWRSAQIYMVDMTTGLLSRVPAPANGLQTSEGVRIRYATDMEFDPAGNLYISQEWAPDQYIFRVTGLLDSTPPTIEPTINGAAGPGGWYRSDVQLSWVVSDPESTVTAKTGCTSSSVTADTTGITFTCTATSLGGTATQSVTIRRDTIAPTLQFAAALPAADADGWNQGDVEISFDAQDALSGVYSTSLANPILFTDEGAGQTRDVTVTDRAGNAATFTTPAVSIDKSLPVIESHVSGALGNNGWYRGNVQISWTVNDSGSAITASEGCDASTVVSDTAGTTFTCSATSHGGTTSKSVTVKRDATPPTLSFSALSPLPGPNGWNNSDVNVGFEANDATSGVQSTSVPSPLLFTGVGAGLFQQVEVTDNAGNAAQFQSPTVNIDRSPPTVQPVIAGTLGNNGWYKGDVSVNWTIGEDTGSILTQTGCDATTVTTDTSGVTFNCSVTSAGGTAGGTVTVKRDATPPTLQFGAFSPAPNTAGWNKTNVTVPFTRADALSGIASTSATSPLTLSAEGAGVTAQVTVTDNAGNSQTFVTDPRNIDKMPPVVSITAPANGASYGFYQDVVANYSCTDVSLLSCTGPNANGDFVNTKTSGPRTFKVTAKDQVAYTTSVTNSFEVANSFNWEGFLPNVVDLPSPNLVAKGSLVPIRWRLPDGHGGFVTNTASFSSATVQSYSCSGTVVPLNDPATGPAGISFDPATNVFTYNWQTGTSWTGCRKLVIKLKDGNLHELVFKFQ